MNTVEFLDAVKKRHDLPSDYALAKFMRWRQQRVSEYRTTPRELDDEGCVQIAAALEIPPAYVMACIAAARAKSASIRKHWEAAARLLKTGTLPLLLVAALGASQFAAPRAEAGEARLTSHAIHYANRRRALEAERRRRRRRRKLQTVTAGAAQTSHAR